MLEDIEECVGMDKKTPQQLYIADLNKFAPTLRMSVMSKEWRLDGSGFPPRQPRTHQEVAKACGLVLEERADINAAGDDRHDRMMVVEQVTPSKPYQHSLGGNRTSQVQCSYCKAVSTHHTTICPQRAADTRNHAVACRERADSTGARCTYVGCNSSSHEAKHHHMAITDYKTPNPGGGKGKGGGAGPYQNWNYDRNNDRKTPFVPTKETQYRPQWQSGGQTNPSGGKGKTGSPTGSGANPTGMRDPCKYG
jgi:hypothetical protein